MKNFLFTIFKQIVDMCKKDVFYTLFFATLIYASVYAALVILGFADIEIYSRFNKSSIICEWFIICKWLIFVSSALTSYKIFKENNKLNSLFIFGIIAILFNPIFKIPFEEGQWLIAIIITCLIYLHFSILFFFVEKNSKTCCVCDSSPKFSKLYRIHVFKGDISKKEKHYDADTYICKNCIDKCQKCENCGQLKMTNEIKQSFGEWNTIDFCYCDRK